MCGKPIRRCPFVQLLFCQYPPGCNYINSNFIKSKPTIYSNFSVIKNAPRQIFRTHVTEYTDYLKDCGLKHSSIYQYNQVLKSLFNVFSKNHIDQIPDLINNPFKDIIKQKGKNERKKKALARAIDWRYVDQIKKLEYSLIPLLKNNGIISRIHEFNSRWAES